MDLARALLSLIVALWVWAEPVLAAHVDAPKTAPAIEFEATAETIAHPERLDRFAPDGISRLSIKAFESDLTNVMPHIARLTGLRRLEIRYCVLSDAAAKSIANLKNLTYLDLTGSGIKGPCFKDLRMLPQLTKIMVGFNRLDPLFVHYLAELPSLQDLFLDHGSLDDAALAAVAKSGRLIRLGISGNNRITGPGLMPLKACKHLVYLDLRDDKVPASSIVALKGLPIEILELSGYTEPERRLIKTAFPQARFRNLNAIDEEWKELFAPLH